MKVLFCFIYLFLLPGFNFVDNQQETAFRSAGNKGIHFFEGTWAEALDLSKKENKMIFLDVYATWCGPCKRMKRKAFKNPKAANLFNQRFLNVSINGETETGKQLADQYGLFGYPSLLILSPQGKVVAQTSGYHSAEELINFANSNEVLRNR